MQNDYLGMPILDNNTDILVIGEYHLDNKDSRLWNRYIKNAIRDTLKSGVNVKLLLEGSSLDPAVKRRNQLVNKSVKKQCKARVLEPDFFDEQLIDYDKWKSDMNNKDLEIKACKALTTIYDEALGMYPATDAMTKKLRDIRDSQDMKKMHDAYTSFGDFRQALRLGSCNKLWAKMIKQAHAKETKKIVVVVGAGHFERDGYKRDI